MIVTDETFYRSRENPSSGRIPFTSTVDRPKNCRLSRLYEVSSVSKPRHVVRCETAVRRSVAKLGERREKNNKCICLAEASSNKEWNICFRCILRRKSLERAILRRQVVTFTWLTSFSAKTSTTSQTHFTIRFLSFHSRHNNHNPPVTNALMYFRIR